MNPHFRFRWVNLILLLTGGFWAGCSVIPAATEDATRYYLLTSPSVTSNAHHGGLRIGLRPVELPAYLLNNRTMVIRRGTNEIRYQDYARWAEPLDLALQHIVRDRLLTSEKVAEAAVSSFGLESKRDYDVSIRIERCEGGIDGDGKYTARLSANYEITDPQKGGEVVSRKHFEASPTRWDGSNFSALAEALSAETASLGDEISKELPASGNRVENLPEAGK